MVLFMVWFFVYGGQLPVLIPKVDVSSEVLERYDPERRKQENNSLQPEKFSPLGP
jgi:hypothetical protein